MAYSLANPWTDLRTAIQARLQAQVDDLVCYPWDGAADKDILAAARMHGRAAWIHVSRAAAIEPAPRRQDAVQIEISILAVYASMAPAQVARAGQGATASEQIEQLAWEIRDQLRDCPLRDWLTGRGIEFVSQTVIHQDPTAVALDLRLSCAGHVEAFSGTVTSEDPLPARVSAQYSADAESWHADYAIATDIYVRFSTDYGSTPGPALRFQGAPGSGADAEAIRSIPVSTTPPAANQVLAYDAGLNQYVPADPIAGADGEDGAPGTDGSDGADAISSVSALPAEPDASTLYRLTAADDTAKAAPGLYRHDGAGWTCLDYSAPYDLGSLGATPSLALIPGLRYTAVHDQAITSCTVAMSRPGMAEITAAGEYAWATPTMTSRTAKLLGTGAWTAAAAALKVVTFEDDGTYLWLSATEGVAP